MSGYVLIVSVIIRIGQGGLTELHTFDTLEICVKNQIHFVEQLRKKVAAIDAQCFKIPPFPREKPPPPPPVSETPKIVPVAKPAPRPVIRERPEHRRKKRITVRRSTSASLKGCAYKKYRVIRGKRVWYCKRRR